MDSVSATFCAMVEQCFKPDQRVVTYRSCPMNAKDTAAALRHEDIDGVVQQWMSDVSRSVRDYITRQAEREVSCAVTTTDFVFTSAFLTKIIDEVREDRIVFYHGGKSYTAATLSKALGHSQPTIEAYSQRFASVMLTAFQSQAKVSPQIKSKRVTAR